MTTKKQQKQPMFISWRWRVVWPLFIILLLVSMIGAYAVASRLGSGIRISQDNVLLESLRGTTSQVNVLYNRQVQEGLRIAYTLGVAEAVQLQQVDVLQPNLEALARSANLDSVILTDVRGVELLGLQRVFIPDVDDYAVNQGTNLGGEPIVMAALNGQQGESSIFQTPEGRLLFVSIPLRVDDDIVGAVLVGQQFATVLDELQASSVTETVVYDASGALAQTTFTLDDAVRRSVRVDATIMQQTLQLEAGRVPVQSVMVADVPYRVGYTPFIYGDNLLGVLGVLLPDSVPFATEVGRQLTGLLAASLVGVALSVVFWVVSRMTRKAEKVQKTAETLATGDYSQRTAMQPVDEVGAVGAALDKFASRVQYEQDAMQVAIRRQRREISHLTSVLESIPDGVVIQNPQGATLFMNTAAQRLLNGHPLTDMPQLQSLANGLLGQSLMPGVYAVGDPQQIALGAKMLSAQAATIMTATQEKIGTLLVLRDITDEVRKEQQRSRLVQQVKEQVQMPLSELGNTGMIIGAPLDTFAREVTKRAVALQKLVAEMRELTDVNLHKLEQSQKPIRLDTLVWIVANDWRQIALAADLQLHVMIEKNGLFVLGDEKRLRWAIGNILDNAIKYTPAGGAITLEVNGESNGQALLRVRDNGVGIADDELAKVFTRFYRGNPTLKDGNIIRTPGMGQGLHTAKLIFEGHGGFIKVRSRQHVGTAVYFSLPLTSAVAMDIPRILEDYEGETVRLPEDALPDFKF